MSQYFLDYYMSFCPKGCDKKDCPKDKHGDIPSPKGCPKQEKELCSRGDLGILTKDELEFLKSQNEDPDIMIFRKGKDIPLNTYEEQAKHLGLLKGFAKNSKWDESLPFYLYHQVKRARELQRLAEIRREVKEESLATIVSVEAAPPTTSPTVAKEPSAEKKLRVHLKVNREDIVKNSPELAGIISEKPDNIRQTLTWKLVSAWQKASKKAGQLRLRVNDEWPDDNLRRKFEDELEDANQELELANLKLHQHLEGDTGNVISEK